MSLQSTVTQINHDANVTHSELLEKCWGNHKLISKVDVVKRLERTIERMAVMEKENSK